ncbi:porin family protein [Stieleria varia]|uniref:Phosphate-selective porin O and P n=1 Tax=Stieleria varia TaxID=2528005 RepID=A0A5C6AYZ8_9BACT|nr:porin [Stieleria varia]TWU04352.1 Phosphate-selective porin O and P [Stieleria varia]
MRADLPHARFLLVAIGFAALVASSPLVAEVPMGSQSEIPLGISDDLHTDIAVEAWGEAFACEPTFIAESSSCEHTGGVSSTSSPSTRVGYDNGFVIASSANQDLHAGQFAYRLRINGYGQLRDTVFRSDGTNPSLNQLQLKRARIIFSGHAFSPDLTYQLQLDGRSNSGDALRILDYYFTYDVGHHQWDCSPGTFGFRAGLYKMPFSFARSLSGKQLEFADRSMASIFFDVNRSLAWGLYGTTNDLPIPIQWEVAVFNGLVTGGAETGSSGQLDNNNAFSARLNLDPSGSWASGDIADFEFHETLAMRMGAGAVFTTIDRRGLTEFEAIRVVDQGVPLGILLPVAIDSYNVTSFSADVSAKYRGVSATLEYYWRAIDRFRGGNQPAILDHGLWFQMGAFVIPKKLELLGRWSRVQGNSGTLGQQDASAAEVSGGFAWYFRDQHLKLTCDATHLDGAPIQSSTLDIAAGDIGWLYRTQFQFSF